MNKPVALFLHMKSSLFNLKGTSCLKYLEKELRHTSKFSNINIVPILTNSTTTISHRSKQVENGIQKIYEKYNEKINLIAYSFASLPVQESLKANKDLVSKVDKLLYISCPLKSSKFCETMSLTSPDMMYHKIVDGCQVDLNWVKEEYNKKSLASKHTEEENGIKVKYLSSKAFLPSFPLSFSQSKIFSSSDIKNYNNDGVVSESDMKVNDDEDIISLPGSHFQILGLSEVINKQIFEFYGKFLK